MVLEPQLKYTFDDLLLIPKHSKLESRDKIEICTDIATTPIISAAMDTVTGIAMQRAMREAGGLGIHHRFLSPELPYQDLVKQYAMAATLGPIAVSPSMGTEMIADIVYYALSDWAYGYKVILSIDVAHGDSDTVLSFCDRLSVIDNIINNVVIWAGNVVTTASAARYLGRGINVLKVGIGPGSACSTRVVAGVGYPQASAIYEIASMYPRASIIADGGINSSGDIVKALALGADAVIVGGLLAGTKQTPGETVVDSRTGETIKAYRGMASKDALESAGKEVNVEGVSGYVPYRGDVRDVVENLVKGVKRGFAYLGARNIDELRDNAEFIRVTQAGLIEGKPRI